MLTSEADFFLFSTSESDSFVVTGLLFEVYHRGVSLQSSLPNCLWALTAMSLPFDSQKDDPQLGKIPFTHGDTTAGNDDDGRDFHLDARR